MLSEEDISFSIYEQVFSKSTHNYNLLIQSSCLHLLLLFASVFKWIATVKLICWLWLTPFPPELLVEPCFVFWDTANFWEASVFLFHQWTRRKTGERFLTESSKTYIWNEKICMSIMLIRQLWMWSIRLIAKTVNRHPGDVKKWLMVLIDRLCQCKRQF